MPSLTSLNLSIIAFLLLIVIHYFTPWPWPLTFNIEHLQRIACDVIKFCTKFEHNRTIRGGVIAISMFNLRTLNMFKRCARPRDNFHQVWPSTTYPCLNYSVFDAGKLCQVVNWTIDLLTLKVRGTLSVTWSKSVRNLSEIEQSPAELLGRPMLVGKVLSFTHELYFSFFLSIHRAQQPRRGRPSNVFRRFSRR